MMDKWHALLSNLRSRRMPWFAVVVSIAQVACVQDDLVVPAVGIDDLGRIDIGLSDARFGQITGALADQTIALVSSDLSSFDLVSGAGVDVATAFEVNRLANQPIKCRVDGGQQSTVENAPAQGPFTFTFQAVPSGMHELVCSLYGTLPGDNQLVERSRASRRVFVEPACTTNPQCDDGNACTQENCVAGKCVYLALANCCASVDACPINAQCVTLQSAGNPKVCAACGATGGCDDGIPCTTDFCDLTGDAGPAAACAYTGTCAGPKPLRQCQKFADGTSVGGAANAWAEWPVPPDSAHFAYADEPFVPLTGQGLARFTAGPADAGEFCLQSPLLRKPPGEGAAATLQFWQRMTAGAPVTLKVKVGVNVDNWATVAPVWTKALAVAAASTHESVLFTIPADGDFRVAICVAATGAATVDFDDACMARGVAPTLNCEQVASMSAGLQSRDMVIGLSATKPAASERLTFQCLVGPSFLQFYPGLYDGHADKWQASADLRQMVKADAGYYPVSLQVSDGVLSATCSTTARITHPGGVLIWAPQAPDHQFQPVRDALVTLGIAHLDTPTLANVGDLSAFSAIIAVFGSGATGYMPTTAEANRLIAYADAGGALAITGNDFWWQAQAQVPSPVGALFQRFGVAASNGAADPLLQAPAAGFVIHVDPTKVPAPGRTYAVSGDVDSWHSADQLAAIAPTCRNVLRVQPVGGTPFWTEVACQPAQGGRTVALSAGFGAYTTLAPYASPEEHARRILNFLLGGLPSCAVNADCDDGDPCTANLCTNVACSYMTPTNCGDGNQCTNDSCDPGTGCSNVADPAATCDDGASCTVGDHCAAGQCITGAAMPCADDGNPCTFDACQAWVGCTHPNNDLPCDDSNPCTGNDHCESGVCAGAAQSLVTTGFCAPGVIGPLPADPKTLAPPLPTTKPASFSDAIGFLWSGSAALQHTLPGQLALNFQPKTVAVARGKVNQRTGAAVAPLPKAQVWVPAHPEWGYVLTRADGGFELVVQGDGVIRIEATKPGFFAVQRKLDMPSRDYVAVDEIVLVRPDPAVTAVSFPPAGGQSAVVVGSSVGALPGSAFTDDTARQPMVVVPPGTTATSHVGTTTAMEPVLSLRVTEYTVGPTGPAAMPADLPPASGYTWCAEFSADEIMSKGSGAWVEFSKPVAVYLDNFLNFPVGMTIPVGWYDRSAGVWKQPRPTAPSDDPAFAKYLRNALVIAAKVQAGQLLVWLKDPQIAGVQPVSADVLGLLGFDAGELAALQARLEALPGGPPSTPKTFWRFQIDHMTPWDANVGFAFVPDPDHPVANPPRDVGPTDAPMCPNKKSGSIILCESRSLGEELPVSGTPLALTYDSRRTPGGRQATVLVPVPPSGPSAPASSVTTVTVAGQQLSPPAQAVNGSLPFAWDGKDAFGRNVNGMQAAKASTTYNYANKRIGVAAGAGPAPSIDLTTAVANALGCTCPADAQNAPLTTCQYADGSICAVKTGVGQTAYLVTLPPPLFGTVAANQGLPTTDLPVVDYSPERAMRAIWATATKRIGVVAAPDTIGGWSIAQHHSYDPGARTLVTGDGEVRQLAEAKSAVESVVGGGTDQIGNVGVDGVAGSQVLLDNPIDDIVAERNGSLFFTAGGRLLERDASGTVKLRCIGVDAQAYRSLAWSGDGRLLAGVHNDAIGQVFEVQVGVPGCNKMLVGGSLAATSAGDFGPAANASLYPAALAVAPDGSIFVAEPGANRRVRRIDPSGVIAPYFGSGADVATTANAPCDAANAAPTARCIGRPAVLAVDTASNLFVGTDIGRLYRVSAAGLVTRLDVAGASAFLAPMSNFGGLAAPGFGRLRYCQLGDGAFRGTGYVAAVDLTGMSERWRMLGSGDATAGDVTAQQATILGGSSGSLTMASCTALASGRNGAWFIAGKPDNVDPGAAQRLLRVSTAGQDWSGDALMIPSESGREVYGFDADGRHLWTKDATTGQSVWSFDHDAFGRLSSVTDADGRMTTITRDAQGVATAIIGPDNDTTVLGIDASGWLKKVVNPAGEAVTLGYSTAANQGGLLTQYVHPNGDTSSFTWDVRGRLIRDTNAAGSFKQLATPIEAISTNTTQTTLTTKMSRVITYNVAHGKDGRFDRTVTDPAGLASAELGLNAASPIAASGQVVAAEGAGIHRADRFTRAADGTATWTRSGPDPQWQAQGSRVAEAWMRLPSGLETHSWSEEAVTPPPPPTTALLGSRTVTAHAALADTNPPTVLTAVRQAALVDGLWQVTATSPANRTSTTKLDGAFRPDTVTAPDLPQTKYAYDSAGRVTSVTLTPTGPAPAPRVTTYGYTAGKLTSVTAGDPPVSMALTNDAAGRVKAQNYADGAAIAFARDTAGRISKVEMPKTAVEPQKPVYGFAFGKAGMLASESVPDAAPKIGWTTQYGYDDDGEVSTVTRADGRTITVNRDAVSGRVVNAVVPDDVLGGAATLTVTPTWDSVGKLSALSSSKLGKVTFGWDGPLNIAQGWAVPAGNDPVTANAPVAGWSVQRAYDTLFRQRFLGLLKVDGGIGLAANHWIHELVDGDGLLTGIELVDANKANPVGLASIARKQTTGMVTSLQAGAASVGVTYNGFAEPADYTVPAVAGTTYREQYTLYDKLGRLTERTVTVGGVTDTWIYTYDQARGWLTSAVKNGVAVGNWAYDVRGNRTSPPATYDAQDKLLTLGARTFAYADNLGRVTGETAPGETRAYTWDAGGHLVKFVKALNGVTTTVEYVLDAQGRRVGKKLNGVMQAGWIYDGALRPIGQTDADGKLTARFVYGTRGHTPDIAVTLDVTTGEVTGKYLFVHDQVGSVVMVVSAADGAIVEQNAYDPWGARTIVQANAVFGHPFGFAGGIHDGATGFVRFGAREYDPRSGRWLSRDPVGLRGGANTSAYCDNDPGNGVDPSGHILVLLLAIPAATGTDLAAGALAAGAAAAALAAARPLIASALDDLADGLTDIWDDLEHLIRRPKKSDPCEHIRALCRGLCTGHLGRDKCDQGAPFRSCVEECVKDSGCNQN